MCCFRTADIFLEDPPPQKKKKEEKKEEEVKKNYVLVSDQLNLQPIVSRHRFPALQFSSALISLTTLHILNDNQLSSLTRLKLSLLPSSHKLQNLFHDAVRNEPAIHLPPGRRNNTAPARSPH